MLNRPAFQGSQGAGDRFKGGEPFLAAPPPKPVAGRPRRYQSDPGDRVQEALPLGHLGGLPPGAVRHHKGHRFVERRDEFRRQLPGSRGGEEEEGVSARIHHSLGRERGPLATPDTDLASLQRQLGETPGVGRAEQLTVVHQDHHARPGEQGPPTGVDLRADADLTAHAAPGAPDIKPFSSSHRVSLRRRLNTVDRQPRPQPPS